MTKTLLAVDGNSLVHRSFHALAGTNLHTADGRPTWAVKGFCSLMLAAVDKVGADALVVGFDDHTHSVRKERWPHYKATRKPKPPELGQQIALTAQLLRDAGVHVVVPDGLEADDVLASASASASAAGWRTVIVTSDRDSFALINDSTSVLRLINGGVDASPILTPDRLVLLNGVRPEHYREYAAMRGDTSDNLTGIHGVGEKTAAKLLEVFSSVQAAFDDVDHGLGVVAGTPGLGKAVATRLANPDNREAFARNVQIMTMRADLDLGLDLHGAGHRAGLLPLSVDAVTTALDGLELHSVRNAALRALTDAGARQATQPVPAEPAWGLEPATHDVEPYDAPEFSRTRPPVPAARPLAAATASAMPGSSAARPTTWDDTLF